MRLLVSIGLLGILLSSCGSDELEPATINGQWELTKGLRNNVETEMLNGLTYTFRPDGSLETNLLGNDLPGNYTLNEQELQTTGVKLPLTYTIQELTDSTLHLRSNYRGFQFDFLLERTATADEE